MRNKHLHLGAGALGLGLTCWVTSRAGFRVTLANRYAINSEERNIRLSAEKKYTVIYPNGSSDTVNIDNFIFYTNTQREIIKTISDLNTSIFTTAIKEYGIRESIDLLAQLFLARSKSDPQGDNPLLFIACENSLSSKDVYNMVLDNLDHNQKEEIARSIIPLNCVVDRICNKPVVDKGVVLMCESFSKWYIEVEREQADVLSLLPNSEHIEIVNNIDDYVTRKKWIVNALHISIAIAARYEGRLMIDRYISEDGGEVFSGLANEIEFMFLNWLEHEGIYTFSEEDVKDYCIQTAERLATHPQLVEDAITRLKKDSLFDFIKDLHRKVIDPYLSFSKREGIILYYSSLIIAIANELIAYERFIDEKND